MASKKVDLVVVQRLALVASKLNEGLSLDETLQAVADGVVDALGFGGATLNYVLPDGDLQAVAVAGPPDAKELLLGQTVPRSVIEAQLARSRRRGNLHFLRSSDWGEVVKWVPDYEPLDEDDAWTPEDGLFMPLRASDGSLVGLLSVDLPPGMRIPDAVLGELLEVFAAHAGLAIDQARLLEKLRAEHSRLVASEAAFRFTFSASACPMTVLTLTPDRPGTFHLVNDAFCDAVGYNQSELLGRTWADLVEPADRPPIETKLAALVRGDRISQRNEQQLVRKDGTKIWTRITHTVVPARHPGAHPFLLTHVEDITDMRAKEATLIHLASIDPLTGLANRRRLTERLSAFLADSNEPRLGYLIYADMDILKEINDRYGHNVGDIVLKEAAARLTEVVRSQDLVARVGGDEFVVFATDLDQQAGNALVSRLRTAFSQPFPSVSGTVSFSFGGTSVMPDGDSTPESVIHQADMAMYAEKRKKDAKMA